MISAMGAREEGRKIWSQAAEFWFKSISRMIWPVTVVPTLAPMMMPRDCRRVRMPTPTRPEVMTMVAVEDWITAVITSPRKKALTGLLVTDSMASFRVPEELSFRPSPMRRIPYRNMARPPNIVSRSNTLISLSFYFHK